MDGLEKDLCRLVLSLPLVMSFSRLHKVSGCSFAGAAIWQYEHLRRRVKQDLHVNAQNRFYGKAGSYRQTVS